MFHLFSENISFDIHNSESEVRAAGLQEQTITLDVALREANQRIQQLESNQRPHQQ